MTCIVTILPMWSKSKPFNTRKIHKGLKRTQRRWKFTRNRRNTTKNDLYYLIEEISKPNLSHPEYLLVCFGFFLAFTKQNFRRAESFRKTHPAKDKIRVGLPAGPVTTQLDETKTQLGPWCGLVYISSFNFSVCLFFLSLRHRHDSTTEDRDNGKGRTWNACCLQCRRRFLSN